MQLALDFCSLNFKALYLVLLDPGNGHVPCIHNFLTNLFRH